MPQISGPSVLTFVVVAVVEFAKDIFEVAESTGLFQVCLSISMVEINVTVTIQDLPGTAEGKDEIVILKYKIKE